MNLNPFILASLKKVAEEAKAPLGEIVLFHSGNKPLFNKRKIEPAMSHKPTTEIDKFIAKQVLQAKLSVLSKPCQASIARNGANITRLVIRFEGLKAKWTVEYPPREAPGRPA